MGAASPSVRNTGAVPRPVAVKLSPPALARLTICYQVALRAGEDGREYLSSSYIASLLDVDETLVRKDMAAVGIPPPGSTHCPAM